MPSAIELLDDDRVARISLRQHSGEMINLECVARATQAPVCEVTFLPDVLDLDALDPQARGRLAFDDEGVTHTVDVLLDKVVSETRLLVIALESFTHVQKRAYFRVDTRGRVRYWLANPGPYDDASEHVHDGVLNLSGGGMRFVVEMPLPAQSELCLLVQLAGIRRQISCTATVVRILGGDDQPLQMALCFDQIENDDRDIIMGHCFAEQRKQLRNSVDLKPRRRV